MREYIIRPFEGRSDIVSSATSLLCDLQVLSRDLESAPSLINIYDGEDRIAIVGLGSSLSTLQCVDKERGTSSRTLAECETDREDLEFVYQGESTFVQAKHLVPQELALPAVVKWITTNELTPDLRWRTREYPPRTP